MNLLGNYTLSAFPNSGSGTRDEIYSNACIQNKILYFNIIYVKCIFALLKNNYIINPFIIK